MAAVIYSLCALTGVVCATMLFRSYFRTRGRLLFWSGWCFVGLAISNLLLVLDRLILPTTDLSTPRLSAAFIGLVLLLVGLIWEGD